jgi:hypothetical protein
VRKTTVLNYQYKLGNTLILQTDSVKDLDVHIDCELDCHFHVYFLFSHAMQLLGLIYTLAVSFFAIDNLETLRVYFAFARFRVEYASLSWKSVTTTDSNELERIENIFASPLPK